MISFCAALLAAIVTLTGSDSSGMTSFTDGTRWSDKQAPSAENDYQVANNLTIRTPQVNYATSETTRKFPGRSLTLGGEDADGTLMLKMMSSKKGSLARTEIGDLRLASSGSNISASWDNTKTYGSLWGKITFLYPMSGVSDLNVPSFKGAGSHYLDLYSELVAEPGYGFKIPSNSSSTDPVWRVALMCDNPDFHGSISVVGPSGTGPGATLTAESAGALGPDPAEPTPLLHLCEEGAFGVEYGSVTIDQPNRGILLTSTWGGRLYAAAGKTLETSMFITSESPLRPLVKSGAGDVFVSGAFGAGDVTVKEGRLGLSGDVASSVTVTDGCAFGPAASASKLSLSGALTLSNTATLRFRGNETANDVIELKQGFTSSVWPIPFKVDGLLAKGTFKQTLFRVHPSVRTITKTDFSCQNEAVDANYVRFISIVNDAEGWQLVNMQQGLRGLSICIR